MVILDRASNTAAEACVITAASGNTLTLANVQFSHASGATVDFGLTLSEESTVRPGPYLARTAKGPIAQFLSAFSRPTPGYSYSITDTAYLANPSLATTSTNWAPVDLAQCDINRKTSAILLGFGRLRTSVDVRLRYVAGWSFANLPLEIKQAVANLVHTQIEPDSTAGGNVKMLKAGDAAIEFFASDLAQSNQALLAPYRTLRLA